jgi:hypothetical protein
MCSPVAAIAAVGTGMQVVGGIKSASAARKQANQQAAGMEANAAQLEWERQQRQADAQAALDAAMVRGAKVREVGKRDMGSTVAAQAGTGMAVDAGSAVDVQIELQRRILEDAAQAELEGERIKKTYEAQASQLGMQAADQRQAAVNTRQAGRAASNSILLSTAANVGSNWISSPLLNKPSTGSGPALTNLRPYFPAAYNR